MFVYSTLPNIHSRTTVKNAQFSRKRKNIATVSGLNDKEDD